MNSGLRKRTYRDVTLVDSGMVYAINLDGKPLRTPAGHVLNLPTLAMAEAVLSEWAGQGDRIDPATMPMTKFAVTATDIPDIQRSRIVDDLHRYAETDAVCYRAQEPPALVEKQRAAWDPLLRWIEAQYGACLVPVAGIMPGRQAPEALDRLHRALQVMTLWELVAISLLTACTGSLVVSLAVKAGHISAMEAWTIAQLDEDYQIAQWGEDEEIQTRHQEIRRDIEDSVRFLTLLDSKPWQ